MIWPWCRLWLMNSRLEATYNARQICHITFAREAAVHIKGVDSWFPQGSPALTGACNSLSTWRPAWTGQCSLLGQSWYCCLDPDWHVLTLGHQLSQTGCLQYSITAKLKGLQQRVYTYGSHMCVRKQGPTGPPKQNMVTHSAKTFEGAHILVMQTRTHTGVGCCRQLTCWVCSDARIRVAAVNVLI